jgi:hypothetical protein
MLVHNILFLLSPLGFCDTLLDLLLGPQLVGVSTFLLAAIDRSRV